MSDADGDEDGSGETASDDGSVDGDGESGPDDLPEVPADAAAAAAADDHALPPEDLQYPEFEFDAGSVGADGSFDLATDLDREATCEWLSDLADGLVTHDVGVAAPDRRVTLGVAPEAVEMAFDPDEDHVGTFEVTIRLQAKTMDVQDADAPTVGARGGRGFVPLAMLTDDADPDSYRCYNWIDDPTADE